MPGPRLIVTRPVEAAERWVGQLVAAGVPAVALPLIGIEPPADPLPLRRLWRDLAGHAFVMFVSGNAVQQFFLQRPFDVTWPADLRAGATGPGTAQALLDAGLAQAQIVLPQVDAGGDWDAEALWQRIGGEPWRGQRVIVVRGERGRDWLAEQWRAAGAEVRFVDAYRRVVPRFDTAQQRLLAEAMVLPASQLWLFSSSEAIQNLRRMAPAGFSWGASRAIATHPRIADAARRAGFGEVRLAAPQLADVLAAWRAWRA